MRASCYVEGGDFRTAQKREEKAILLGSQQGISYHQHRMLFYRSGKAWREHLRNESRIGMCETSRAPLVKAGNFLSWQSELR
jgi:hypothetical protein